VKITNFSAYLEAPSWAYGHILQVNLSLHSENLLHDKAIQPVFKLVPSDLLQKLICKFARI